MRVPLQPSPRGPLPSHPYAATLQPPLGLVCFLRPYSLREQLGTEAYPKAAREYLNDWAAPDKGWLRKFYKPGTDEAQFDLTPATEKAIAWLLTLTERPFVGTESRL
ncbi:DUF3375 family protein, partial [Cutibacterium acnes]